MLITILLKKLIASSVIYSNRLHGCRTIIKMSGSGPPNPGTSLRRRRVPAHRILAVV